jgi:type 1 glutamine amidotransferase
MIVVPFSLQAQVAGSRAPETTSTPNTVPQIAAQGRPPAAAGLCNEPCDPYPGMKKLLIVADVQTGFQHDSNNHTIGVIEEMGRKTGIFVTYIRTDSQLITKGKITGTSKRYANRSINARNINYFDAVLFLGSGEGTMSDQQKADLVSYVHDDGKGLLLGHAQGVDMYNWPEFGEMIGGFMEKEYPATGMFAKVVDSSWKAAAAFGKEPFLWKDQWPVLQAQFKPGDVHTIIALDATKMTTEEQGRGRPDGYYPIVWAKEYGKGRVFNITGGHNDSTIDDPRMQALWLEGIEWALGTTIESATPDKKMDPAK